MTRLMIYAQVPPPVHGQSVMVGHLIDGLCATGQVDLNATTSPSANATIAFCHINPQISEDLADIGRWRPRKLLLVFGFILQSIRAKFRHDLDAFYFVPAPPKRAAIYRDWCVLFFARLFYRNLILHWHCIGQPAFIQKLSAPERFLTRLLYGRAALSIPLSKYSHDEASWFHPKKSEIVPNGIPDPCPAFDAEVWPERQRRAAERQAAMASGAPYLYEVLFLAGRMTPKGLFDSMSAVAQANKGLAERGSSVRMRLTIAGSFDDDERARYEAAAKEIDALRLPGTSEPLSHYAGWADEAKKRQLFCAADCFIFPTVYPAESFGLVLTEAMAHGCAVITTRWQAVPEVLPPDYPDIAEPHDIAGLSAALLRCAADPADRTLRDYFLQHFTAQRFVRDMIRVLSAV